MSEQDTIFEKLVAIAFFVFIYLSFAQYIGYSDLWWHMSNGRWIVDNMALPSTDPFMHTVPEGYDMRANLLLKGFWLAQVLYYLTYKAIGFIGLILINAGLLTATLFLLWRFIKAQGASTFVACLLLLPCIVFLNEYEIRPKNFSYLATLVMFIIIEAGFYIREDNAGRSKPFYVTPFALMPLVMLIWPNIHRGFFLGYLIMGVYLVSYSLMMLKDKKSVNRDSYLRFLKWAAVAVVASFINPNPFEVFLVNLQEIVWSGKIAVLEFLSLADYAYTRGMDYYVYLYYLLVFLVAASMAISYKRVKLPHLILALGFCVMGIRHIKFSIYFVLISGAMLGLYLPLKCKQPKPAINKAICILSLTLIFFALSDRVGNSVLTSEAPVRRLLPEKALVYIAEHDLPRQIFNPYEWGGYISWNLYPEYKVFIDSRMLNLGVHDEYLAASNGYYRETFEKYDINSVLVDPLDIVTGYVSGLALQLLSSSEWTLLYFDYVSAIFVRADAAHGVTGIDKNRLRGALIKSAKYDIEMFPENPKGYLSLAAIYYSMNRWDLGAEAEKKAQSLKGGAR
jgi:hypothetical protein